MLRTCSDGSLCLAAPFYKTADYDCANATVLSRMDGCFNITRFSLAGGREVFTEDSFYSTLSLDGIALSALAEKQVTMLGALQRVELALDRTDVVCETFLDKCSRAVFQRFTAREKEGRPLELRLDFGVLLSAEGTAPEVRAQQRPWGMSFFLPDGRSLDLACSGRLELREIQDVGIHCTAIVCAPPLGGLELRLVYDADGDALLEGFDRAYRQAADYATRLREWGGAIPEEDRAQFISCLNCGISSYKDVPGFKGLFAGVHYRTPLRTYYRDGYFTALALLPFAPELVREELRTLARGIAHDGTAPSAVIDGKTDFWPDHRDAPAFFVLLLHDYVAATGEAAILEERIGGSTLLELARCAVDGLITRADGTGLVYRESGNRHDWADNVYREGYITYIEALYYRALTCLARLLGGEGERYQLEAERVKNSANDLLWLEDKGWYADYRSEKYAEDHLAIDTVLAALFGLAPPERARRLLSAMERLLESANNTEQPFGDWGTMCCWPPYGNAAHLVEKSSKAYSYHNGSDWPYWSGVYAYTKYLFGQDGSYPLRRWFTYGLEQGWCTPVEYYSPSAGRGSSLQAWSAFGAFTFYYRDKKNPFHWGETEEE